MSAEYPAYPRFVQTEEQYIVLPCLGMDCLLLQVAIGRAVQLSAQQAAKLAAQLLVKLLIRRTLPRLQL